MSRVEGVRVAEAVGGGGEARVVEGEVRIVVLKGVLLVLLVEQFEPVVLVKVQALGDMGMGGGKDWSSRRSQMEVCHFAHNPHRLSSY
jgi:hypothetical protein